MNKKRSYRIISMLLAITVIVTSFLAMPKSAEAVNYITVRSFIKRVVTTLNLETNGGTSFKDYRKAAIKVGIVKKGDFTYYKSAITRTDCAVILNRVDQYLNGETLTSDYVTTILNERISDINKISSSKREAVARVYGLGIIKGYSNGKFTRDREFRGSNKVAVKTAQSWINATVNPKQREKLSSDGQLLRATNLPKNADKFAYILDSFPNSFYEYRFEFERIKYWGTADFEYKYMTEYCYPVDMDKYTVAASYDVQKQMELYMAEWVKSVEEYLNLAMNVDYRTIDKEWQEKIAGTFGNIHSYDKLVRRIETYVVNMKKLNVVVETEQIVVEPSTFHANTLGYCIRAYVRYKVITPDIIDQGSVIFSPGSTWIANMESGVWKDAYFDIQLGFWGDKYPYEVYMKVFPVNYLNYRP